MNTDDTNAGAVGSRVDRGVGRLDPERGADGVWRVTRWPCRGPCWNGYWTVSRELRPGVWENVLNNAGKMKRFRSEAAAEAEAGKRNGTWDRAARMLKSCRLPAEVPW